jgi:transmembrane sensor
MKIDYQIIKRYLEDRGSKEDEQSIINWFNSLQAEKELLHKSRQYWDEIPENVNTVDYNESLMLGNIYRKIKIDEAAHKPPVPVRILSYLTKIAAVLFIPLVILYAFNDKIRQSASSNMAYTQVYAPVGSRTMFYLPDGSKGWLNGGSYLQFSEHFQGKTRNVSLKGEAFFEIVTDPDKPFIVSGKSLDIEAKGTSFNVQCWEDDPDVNVVLVEGELEILRRMKDKTFLVARLKPGQLLHYNTSQTADGYIQNVDVEKYTAWKDGKLVFREDPFAEVVESLNRWYNVNIVIKDKILMTYKYVATFEDETLYEILRLLRISAPIDYKILERKQLEDGTFEKRTIELYYKPKKN